jgi:hypothetical protein
MKSELVNFVIVIPTFPTGKASSMQINQIFTHSDTNDAQRSLNSEINRELVYGTSKVTTKLGY